MLGVHRRRGMTGEQARPYRGRWVVFCKIFLHTLHPIQSRVFFVRPDVGACPARPNGVSEVNGMIGDMFFPNELSCDGHTSSQRFDGRAGSPLRGRKGGFLQSIFTHALSDTRTPVFVRSDVGACPARPNGVRDIISPTHNIRIE